MSEIVYRSLKPFKYQLTQDYVILTPFVGTRRTITNFINLDGEGVLTIKKGYAWNGSSGPAIDTKKCMRASCVHDCLFQLFRERKLPLVLRARADQFYHDICIEDGMGKFQAAARHWALKLFGGKHAKPKDKVNG